MAKRDADERRFDELYQHTFEQVYAYCVRRVDRRDDVDDIVSEIYTIVWRRLDDATAATTPLAWIYGIAYRTISNQRRSRGRAGRLVQRLAAQVPTTDGDPGDHVAATELEAAAREALAELPETDRELLQLTIWEELGPSDIAGVLDMDVAAVRRRLYRARQRLQGALQGVLPRDESVEPDTTQLDPETDHHPRQRRRRRWDEGNTGD